MSRSFYRLLRRRQNKQRLTGKDRVGAARHKQQDFVDRLPEYLKRFPHQIKRPRGLRIEDQVIVIGGGFAGLSAAWCLSRCGVRVTVLEADKRVGGRVLTLEKFIPERRIEGGGELIGANHPAWLAYAQYFGLGLSAVTSDDSFAAMHLENQPLVVGGKRLSDAEAQRIYDLLTAAFKTLVPWAKAIKHPHQPWRARHARKLDKLSVANWIEGLTRKQLGGKAGKHRLTSAELVWLKAALHAELENTNAVATSQQSLLGLVALMRGGQIKGDPLGFWSASESFRCENGNETLAKCFKTELNRGKLSSVHEGHQVEEIEIGTEGVTVTAVSKKGRKPFTGSHVILAVPPTVLTDIEITPAIPDGNTMNTGKAVKYLSAVASRFWIQQKQAPHAVSDQLGMIWEGTDNQNIAGPAELTLFAGGRAAERALLNQGNDTYFQKGIARLYPGYKPSFVEGKFMAWPKNPYARTGYSCPAPGQVCTVGKFLSKVFAKRLVFAGEHTCLPYFGYMEGALQSGLQAAIRLIESASS